MPTRQQVRNVFLRALGCGLLIYHMLAVAVANLSTTTAVRDLPHRWFRPYTTFFSQWQEWDMFTTIPYYADVRPTLVATNANNTTTEYGPWLPELGAAPRSLKLTSLFARSMWSRNVFGASISRWERAACAHIKAHTGSAPKSVHLKLDTLRLNALNVVRSSNQIAHPEQFSTKPTACKK